MNHATGGRLAVNDLDAFLARAAAGFAQARPLLAPDDPRAEVSTAPDHAHRAPRPPGGHLRRQRRRGRVSGHPPSRSGVASPAPRYEVHRPPYLTFSSHYLPYPHPIFATTRETIPPYTRRPSLRVLLAANEVPAINDVTASELSALLGRLPEGELREAFRNGRLQVWAPGRYCTCPCNSERAAALRGATEPRSKRGRRARSLGMPQQRPPGDDAATP